jgi:hypothetical protein
MDYSLRSDAIGTYVRVIQCSRTFHGDAYLVMYLLSSGLYLFIGYWAGCELTVAAGRWKGSDGNVYLKGVGAHLHMDQFSFSKAPRKHEREFRIVIENYSCSLLAETEHSGWSLLSWPGHLHYLGSFYFFDLNNERLPKSFKDVEPWTQRFLDDYDFRND